MHGTRRCSSVVENCEAPLKCRFPVRSGFVSLALTSVDAQSPAETTSPCAGVIRATLRKFEKTEECRPVTKMNNTAWKAARERAADKWQEQSGGETAPEGFRRVRVHDLKHTFGRRLRAAGVSFEDRQDLLGLDLPRFRGQFAISISRSL